MTDDREPFREAREHGLKARQEQKLARATYTAAEVKVLTEVALRLGRKEALDEAASIADELAEGVVNPQKPYNEAFIHACGCVSRAIRDATSGRTDPGMDSDLPPDRQAARKRYPHAHACVTCSPDGREPGPGCINCRNTGWDQTPCQAEGHKPQCPHGCCDPNIPGDPTP